MLREVNKLILKGYIKEMRLRWNDIGSQHCMVIKIGLLTNCILHWVLSTCLISMKMMWKTFSYKCFANKVVYVSMKYNDIFHYAKSGNSVHSKNYNTSWLVGSPTNFNPWNAAMIINKLVTTNQPQEYPQIVHTNLLVIVMQYTYLVNWLSSPMSENSASTVSLYFSVLTLDVVTAFGSDQNTWTVHIFFQKYMHEPQKAVRSM